MTDTLFPLMDDRQQRLLAGEAVVVRVSRSKGRFVDPLAAFAEERGLLVYIGHRTPWTRPVWPESEWANPFSTEMKHGATREDVIRRFEQNLRARTDPLARLGELRGRALGCWCWPESARLDNLGQKFDCVPLASTRARPGRHDRGGLLLARRGGCGPFMSGRRTARLSNESSARAEPTRQRRLV